MSLSLMAVAIVAPPVLAQESHSAAASTAGTAASATQDPTETSKAGSTSQAAQDYAGNAATPAYPNKADGAGARRNKTHTDATAEDERSPTGER